MINSGIEVRNVDKVLIMESVTNKTYNAMVQKDS